MKKRILFLLSILASVAIVSYVWSYVGTNKLQSNNREVNIVKQQAIKTIESLHSRNKEFLTTISDTPTVRNLLIERMELLKNSNFENVEVMEIRAVRWDSFKVVVFFSSDVYKYLEYTFTFRKTNNSWKIVGLEIE